MSIGLEKHVKIVAGRIFLNLLICILFIPTSAPAVQWQKLTQTSRFNVSIDMDSVLTRPESSISFWLSFIPHGTQQLKEAAKDYSQKAYRQHMEYYEIDCIEQSAALRRVDFLGKKGKRIYSITGNGSTPDAIIPGSSLDAAALLVCPKQEYVEAEEQRGQEKTVLSQEQDYSDRNISDEHKQIIAEAKTQTESKATNAAAWIELGNAYFDADMPKESIEAYRQALKIKPDNIEVLNDQGAMYRRIGEFQNALNNHEKVLAIAPDNLETLYIIGYIYAVELDRTKDAIPLWQRYLAIDSSSETASQIKQYIEKYGK